MIESAAISLVIPVFNESNSITVLIKSIDKQTFQPGQVLFIDAGSTDNTVKLIREATNSDKKYKVIEAGRAMPGKARNIGVSGAATAWIAFTDAGIKLETSWLKKLVNKADENPETAMIYGNYHPIINTWFEKCATMAYVPPLISGKIRGRFIASSMVKKEVWEKTGGFPDWRAAEDLIFIEKAEQLGYKVAYAPEANVYWQLRPGIISTFKRFDLYSKYNVWAGRQAYWHYGVARQYSLVTIFILLGIFHYWVWFFMIPAWLIARTAKRIFMHRHEFGWKELFNPITYLGVMLITVVVDAATFTGWLKALLSKPVNKISKS
ncbi:MAG: glycosyltransferase [Sphingobacteriales bacterium]|nr:glycosyltransferase [Sphingobacteriales bacterium]